MSDECHQDFVNFILACEIFPRKKVSWSAKVS